MGYVLCENAKFSKKKILGRVPARSGSNISGPTPKFKIPLPRLFSPGPKVSKKVCHTPVGQKLREEIDFLETGRFRPRAVTFGPADLILPPKNYLREVGLVLKFSSRSFHSIKSYSTFSQGQTGTHPPIHIYALFDPFNFTMIASITRTHQITRMFKFKFGGFCICDSLI